MANKPRGAAYLPPIRPFRENKPPTAAYESVRLPRPSSRSRRPGRRGFVSEGPSPESLVALKLPWKRWGAQSKNFTPVRLKSTLTIRDSL